MTTLALALIAILTMLAYLAAREIDARDRADRESDLQLLRELQRHPHNETSTDR